ncbi:helix-turn-helix transcriptional regulator [Pectinatus frisingensis]|uniref:helix-turn-helix transcriptional regulator n=1 Tax=Pectinatus frisingensis TaxID=865 RepID=UPI0018C69716|nr:helix-turn-helix transcriptional regulator [Pectinatus frisingensis]
MEDLFGDKLKKIRTERELTQQQFADLLGTSKQVISRYETNQRTPKITIAQEYADKLNVPLNYLIDDNIASIEVNDNRPLPDLTKKDERQIQKKLKALLDDLDPAAGVAYYNDEEPISDEDKELLRISLENTLRLTKQLAKQKFTPKKYRKE